MRLLLQNILLRLQTWNVIMLMLCNIFLQGKATKMWTFSCSKWCHVQTKSGKRQAKAGRTYRRCDKESVQNTAVEMWCFFLVHTVCMYIALPHKMSSVLLPQDFVLNKPLCTSAEHWNSEWSCAIQICLPCFFVKGTKFSAQLRILSNTLPQYLSKTKTIEYLRRSSKLPNSIQFKVCKGFCWVYEISQSSNSINFPCF